MKPKNPATALSIYIAVAIALLAGIGVAIATIVASSAGIQQQTAKPKSPLEVQVASAREIREALARPIAGPEPLQPISSKVKPPVKVAEAKAEPPPKPKRLPRVMRQARQAFAGIGPFQQEPPFFQFMAFGAGGR